MAHSITKEYRTETGHRLHPYDGKCSHFHGHSYLWRFTIAATSGELDEQGMVADFGVLKKAMVSVLEPLDHCMVLCKTDPLVVGVGEAQTRDLLEATNGAPARVVFTEWNPTAENFAAWAAVELQGRLPVGIEVVEVEVWETATSRALWRQGAQLCLA